ncbi:hypothetical protein DUNSADRAFT_77 [Dunaliella salina]|uniref:Uncharacterized protein n=1 Tax=Dunaliella salina TaxID=3046 RepID=A0ABQ7H8X5_DUNSA|nr:hypothetical protein DUNSADRAFT_77 [Dunaliella salina]|eukprot:KAF5843275.1 hypothetical protein DUNSADRAFT_77 [Dunaliella salina]
MGFCSCIPPPASVQPRKTYNVLVPDVFGNLGPAPKLEDAISPGTARKIGKLQEYVQNNPSKAAKVSRRLTRRIKKALNEHTLGDVKVAVHAYKHLLNESTAKDSSYTFSYFSKELIQEPDVVVSVLEIIENDEHGKAWLLEQAEEKMRQPPPATLQRVPSASGASRTNSHSSGGSFLNKLGSLRHPGKDHPFQRSSKDVDHHKGHHKADSEGQTKAGSQTQAGHKTAEPQRPVDVALDVLSSYRPFLRDISTVRRVMETLLSWLDKNSRWDRRELVEGLLALVQSFAGDLTFPLTSCLMRHCANPSTAPQHLTPHQRATVVRLAALQGMTYSLSTLSLALSELPKVCEAVGLVLRGGSAPSQPSTAAASSSAALEASRLRLCTLECGLTVLNAIPTFAGRGCAFSGCVLPPTLLRALADACTTTPLATAAAASRAPEQQQQQQLWQLQQQQGHVMAKLLRGMMAPLGSNALRDERQALMLLQLAGQWLGLVGAPPLPGSTSPDNSDVLDNRPATAPSSNGSPGVDSSHIRVAIPGDRAAAPSKDSPIGGPAMVPPPPAFDLASHLVAAALTCGRGPGPALGAARLALHAHCTALLTKPPLPSNLEELLQAADQSPREAVHTSLFLPQPPANGNMSTPDAKDDTSDDEAHSTAEEFGTPGTSTASNVQTPGSQSQTPHGDFGTPSTSFRGKSGLLNRPAEANGVEPPSDKASLKWRAGLLVLADVVVQQLAVAMQCESLRACEVSEARSWVPELKFLPPKSETPQSGSQPTALIHQHKLRARAPGQRLAVPGSMLADAYGGPGLTQQLCAPLECCCDARDVACASWLVNGISRMNSGLPADTPADVRASRNVMMMRTCERTARNPTPNHHGENVQMFENTFLKT